SSGKRWSSDPLVHATFCTLSGNWGPEGRSGNSGFYSGTWCKRGIDLLSLSGMAGLMTFTKGGSKKSAYQFLAMRTPDPPSLAWWPAYDSLEIFGQPWCTLTAFIRMLRLFSVDGC